MKWEPRWLDTTFNEWENGPKGVMQTYFFGVFDCVERNKYTSSLLRNNWIDAIDSENYHFFQNHRFHWLKKNFLSSKAITESCKFFSAIDPHNVSHLQNVRILYAGCSSHIIFYNIQLLALTLFSRSLCVSDTFPLRLQLELELFRDSFPLFCFFSVPVHSKPLERINSCRPKTQIVEMMELQEART